LLLVIATSLLSLLSGINTTQVPKTLQYFGSLLFSLLGFGSGFYFMMAFDSQLVIASAGSKPLPFCDKRAETGGPERSF